MASEHRDSRAIDLETAIATVLGTVNGGALLPTAVVLPHGASSNQLSWLPWYATDFYGNPMVEAMTDRQQNRYRRLLDKSWQLDPACFLPTDLDVIASMCRCTPLDFQQDAAVILARFKQTTDRQYYYQTRLLREYCKAIQPFMARTWAAQKTNDLRKRGRLAGLTDLATAHATVIGTVDGSGATTTTTTTTTVKKGESRPEETPDGLHQLQYASKLLESLGLPEKGNLESVASAISSFAKHNTISKASAYERILARALDDRDQGEEINMFWFRDARYGVNGRRATPKAKPRGLDLDQLYAEEEQKIGKA